MALNFARSSISQYSQLGLGKFYRTNFPILSCTHALSSNCTKPMSTAVRSLSFVGLLNTFLQHENILTMQHRYAGHSKWQNTRHIKEAKNRAKNILFNRLASQITHACKDGINPATNLKLQAIIDEARKCQMPTATINSVISKSQRVIVGGKEGYFEYCHINGMFVVVKYISDKKSKAQSSINPVAKKLGFIQDQTGKAASMFNKRGVIVTSHLLNDKEITEPEAEEFAIEADAEEVVLENDTLMFFTAEEDLSSATAVLRKLGLSMQSSEVEFIPKDYPEFSNEEVELMELLCDRLQDVTEVLKVFSNVR